MRKFDCLDAVAAPLPLANVDTDKILPGQFLKTISREGLGEKLFWDLRQDAGFVLNRHPWNKAGILVARENFGCGSSREHAPWALLDFGIRCIIAPSFAGIFQENCLKNGILPVVLPIEEVERLLQAINAPTMARLSISLIDETVISSDGRVIPFTIAPRNKFNLINGVDEISETLRFSSKIECYEKSTKASMRWICEEF